MTWVSPVTSESLCFLIYTMGIIPISGDYYEDYI